MPKSTKECRAGCEVYADWKELEATNARLVSENRWIPEDEPPEESGTYQVVRKINRYPTTREYCAKSLMWLSQDTVTHWKPIILPED